MASLSAEHESLLVIGGVFIVAAVVFSVAVIGVHRAGLRFDQWLVRKIPLRLAGFAFYCGYALWISLGITVLVVLNEVHLFSPAKLLLAGSVFLAAVGAALAWHRKSLRERGIRLFKRKSEEDVAP